MNRSHWYWAFARPTLLWACLPLLFAGLHPGVSEEKFGLLVLLTVLLFFFRGAVDKGWVERVIEKWRS
jgi:hypothetical protein